MAGWHQTIVIGNVGRDPELRYTQSGAAVCSFSVAVTERWTDRQNFASLHNFCATAFGRGFNQRRRITVRSVQKIW